MIAFPNCKINLGLHILRKREDGYHDLETFFYPVKLYDALEILPSKSKTEIIVTGAPAGNTEDNLCMKALHLLKKDYPGLPEVRIHLHKAVPMGAGLGGGSADAAFTLSLLNEKFGLEIPADKMSVYALQLGSDCAFFLLNKPGLATSRGEVIAEAPVSLKEYKILLVNPGIHISTATAFKNIEPALPSKKIMHIIEQPVETWKDELSNDFEKYVFIEYPAVKKIKESLYNAGATYAAMSGSGSTVFGIFKKELQVNYKSEPGYFCKMTDTC